MIVLIPRNQGQGTRKNQAKPNYLLTHLGLAEYRCGAYASVSEARELEGQLQAKTSYIFPT